MIPNILFAILTAHLGPMVPDGPARQPQIAANSSLVAVAFGAGKSIYFTSSRDGGRTFAPPTKVAQEDVISIGRHRGPRIALAGNAIVITAVASNKPKDIKVPFPGDLLVWRSTDGGKTWSAGKPINDIPDSAAEGLHTLASDGSGLLFAAWLENHGAKGKMLYAAKSTDGGITWTKNVAAYRSPDGSICECCHPSAAIDAAGNIAVMWRNSLSGARDMYLATSRDGETFSSPQKLGNGTWHLNACPMDGGGIAIAPSGIVTAWRREANVFLAEPGKPERQLGAGKDIALAVSANRTYVSWVNGAKVEVWIDGKAETLSTAGAFPSLTSLPAGGVLASWEEGGTIQIRRLP